MEREVSDVFSEPLSFSPENGDRRVFRVVGVTSVSFSGDGAVVFPSFPALFSPFVLLSLRQMRELARLPLPSFFLDSLYPFFGFGLFAELDDTTESHPRYFCCPPEVPTTHVNRLIPRFAPVFLLPSPLLLTGPRSRTAAQILPSPFFSPFFRLLALPP